MAPLRVLIVDDEAVARCNLVILLRDDPEIGTIVECDSGQAAVAEMRRTPPDMVFLDVQMPECDGFDVLELMLHLLYFAAAAWPFSQRPTWVNRTRSCQAAW